jgi:hypothetical protein
VSGELKSETLFIENRDDAFNKFKEKWGVTPSFLDGPFYRKLEKNKKPIHNKEIKMGSKMIRGIYKNTQIKGITLVKPENYIFVTYCEDKNLNQNVIHISEIKELK